MPRSAPTTAASIEERRHSESLRKRKYRAGKRTELIQLETELRTLQDQLAYLTAPRSSSSLFPSTTPPPAIIARRYNESLKAQVTLQRRLARTMSLWTATQQPRLVRTDNISHVPPLGLLTVERSQGPIMRSSWMQSTLLANPAARQQGYRWLSDRVLHTSQRHPHPFGDAVADRVSVVAHRGEDTDGATVAAIEGHYQFTAFGDFRHVSQRLWVANIAPTAVTVIQMLDDQPIDGLMYYHSTNLVTNVRVIARQYIEASRVVLTYTTIVEHVTDQVSLVRHSNLQYTPVTSQGVASLAEIAQLFRSPFPESDGQSPLRNREARVVQLQSAAEAMFTHMYTNILRRLNQMFGPS
ncbi:hypothetical protein B5M09_009841 [Aphanomyces astaci]|uniref:Uncharacterized protein n=1 Tax=Aphanomyces astaci TaxID=112090 RepID=A0A425CW24_APHAT|nr:hypothetical protein B5M09_009841 [Aphanomyces astaci]